MKRIILFWAIFCIALFTFPITAYADDTSSYLLPDWEYKPEASLNKVLVADLNGDGKLEIIASSGEGVVYNLGKEVNGHVNWQYKLRGEVKVLKIIDFDGDGKLEVIAGSNFANTNLALIDWQGLDEYGSLDFSSPVNDVDAGDIDGDKKNDLAIASIKTVYAMLFTKSVDKIAWDYQADGTIFYVRISDYNKDGKGEIMAAASWSVDETSYGEVFMLDASGKKLWSYPVKGGFAMAAINPVASYDINSNGAEEILVGSKTGGLIILDGSGNVLMDYPTEKQINVVYVSNLSGANNPTTFLGATPYVYALDSLGSLLWKYQLNTTVFTILSKDVDGDGRTEVLVGANKHLHILSDKGDAVAVVNYGTDIKSLNQNFETKNIDVKSVAVGDLNNDKVIDVVAAINWVESRLDHNYVFGDLQVFKVNKDYVGSQTGVTKPTVGKTTTTTVKASSTTTNTQTTSPVDGATTTTIKESTQSPVSQGSSLLIVGLIIAGGIILVLVVALLYVLTKKKN